MGHQKGSTETILFTGFLVIATSAIVGLIFLLFQVGVALGVDQEAQERTFQAELRSLNCVHVGYRGRGEEKIYSCGGRLMQRGRDGLKYSN